MTTVKLRYAASSNISFKGEYDTKIEREDWERMSAREQGDVYVEALEELVDIWDADD